MKIIFGSHNPHKLLEIQALFKELDIDSLPVGIPDVAETGQTFSDNARIKSEYYARATGHWVIADDSGLSVDALDGAPGVLSARYSGEDASDEQNNLKLLQELKNITERQAAFVCVLSLSSPDGEIFQVEGRCEGSVLTELDGSNGFGYDPLFYSHELKGSFGKALASDKNSVSHRFKASTLFLNEFTQRFQYS